MVRRVVYAGLILLACAGCAAQRAKELPPNMVEVEDGREWVVTARRTTLRPEPNVFRKVGTIPVATRLTVDREIILLYDDEADETVAARRRNEHWYMVEYRGQKGWITMWDTTTAPDTMSAQPSAGTE